MVRSSNYHDFIFYAKCIVVLLLLSKHSLTLNLRHEDLDGTNNNCERLIGWWIKERYRTMCGYKRQESIRNVVFLTALMGARQGYFEMTPLVA